MCCPCELGTHFSPNLLRDILSYPNWFTQNTKKWTVCLLCCCAYCLAVLAALKELLIEAAIIYEDDPDVPLSQLPEKINELKDQLPELRAAKRNVARMRMENSEQLNTIEELKGRRSTSCT